MVHVGNDEIVEYVRFGIGFRMRMRVQDHALLFEDRGYVWKLGKYLVPLPLRMLIGYARIVESAVNEHTINVDFDIRHPLFGRTFGYRGCFMIQKPNAADNAMFTVIE
jgi:hypothetical protein